MSRVGRRRLPHVILSCAPQVPTQVFGTEGRYATALYTAAAKNKQVDVVEKDLNAFKVRFMNCCCAERVSDCLALRPLFP